MNLSHSICGRYIEEVLLENSYVGQTQTHMNTRINGHRACFVEPKSRSDEDIRITYDKIKQSALALHAHEKHPDNFNINIFKFMLMDSVQGRFLDKRESRGIGELRTNVIGINRMKVQK